MGSSRPLHPDGQTLRTRKVDNSNKQGGRGRKERKGKGNKEKRKKAVLVLSFTVEHNVSECSWATDHMLSFVNEMSQVLFISCSLSRILVEKNFGQLFLFQK
jgi:hypothetical protein